jgi:hypothetical protein
MAISEWAHWIGLFGEALNLAGAIVLARDIFNRQREHDRRQRRSKMSADFRERNAKSIYYKGVTVAAPDFAERVAQVYAMKLAYWGLGLLIAGFSCLAAYHLLDIVDARNGPQSSRQYFLDKKFRISDNDRSSGGSPCSGQSSPR